MIKIKTAGDLRERKNKSTSVYRLVNIQSSGVQDQILFSLLSVKLT